MSSFAIYRLPHAEECTFIEQTEGEPEQLRSCRELSNRTGFVFAPFQITSDCPLLLIRPNRITHLQVGDFSQLDETVDLRHRHDTPCDDVSFSAKRNQYREDFTLFHQELCAHHFEKLVLSRCASIPISASNGNTNTPIQLFQRACEYYPRLFICLVSTPKSGTWLAATPEILLEGKEKQWRTIALAGTMRLEGDGLQGEGEQSTWSTKNIQEQRYVGKYLTEQLKPFVSQLHEEGPRTVRAANLVHLRSDFTFTLLNNVRVGDLLQALHPTPAVCGLPKDEAFSFILSNEHTQRQYYSGFMGPLAIPHPTSPNTHLYVSLRCMQITATHYRLYAGGGLLKDSIEEQEWQETEAKMETMRQLIEKNHV